MKQPLKYIFAFFFFNLILTSIAYSQKKKKEIPAPPNQEISGANDRAFWVKTLYRISNPIIENLAEGTLRKKLPIEKGPGYRLNAEKVTYLEAVGRTMAGLAPWLALPDDATTEGKLRKELRSKLLIGLKNAVNPASADYLNFRSEQQPIVDAAFMAHAFLRAPDALWKPLDSLTKQRIIEEFKALRNRKAGYNNWLLFSGINEAFLLSVGADYDPARIDFAFRKMKEWYVGDGWYSDGEKFSFDYYNSFVIHPMLVDMLKVMVANKLVAQADYDQAEKRMIRYAEFVERFISPEGTYPPFGRSITYRTAVFQPLCQVALIQKLPNYISPAQVRCGITKVMHNMFDGEQNFDKDGWLLLGFNGAQPSVADTYSTTGSLYLCTLGFLTLGLPAENIFWSAPAADWTSKKAWNGEPFMKDYKVEW